VSFRSWLWTGFIAVGCGGAPKHTESIAIVPTVAVQSWYRSPANCAQGPYELEVATRGAKHGEDVELRVHAPHPIELHAVVVADGTELGHESGVYVADGQVIDRKPANAKCVASAGERLQLAHAAGGAAGSGGPAGSTGEAAPPGSAQPVPLVATNEDVIGSAEVIHVRVPPGHARVAIRFWSIEPNDLDGVLFGTADITWAPNVPEEQYEAHLRSEAERQRIIDEQWRRAHAQDRVVTVDPAEEERKRVAAERARAEAERAHAEAERRAAIAAALEEEQRRRRAAYCDAHAEDRDCWGAGGRRVSDDLAHHEAERSAYCAAHAEDARCWTSADWSRHQQAWNTRLDSAAAQPKPPDGPPPAPLAETPPPKLSLHADWRPGYWQWTEGKWVWLTGMWRVPESDIVAEQTTTAPHAPPPLQIETPPPAPVTVAVWVPGFWQWSGASWVWIAGSWQLRPAPSATWQPAEWRARGTVHVLIPGRWVR